MPVDTEKKFTFSEVKKIVPTLTTREIHNWSFKGWLPDAKRSSSGHPRLYTRKDVICLGIYVSFCRALGAMPIGSDFKDSIKKAVDEDYTFVRIGGISFNFTEAYIYLETRNNLASASWSTSKIPPLMKKL